LSKTLKKLFFGIICYPIYLFSKLIPKSNNIWIFGAWFGEKYTDNPSYLYEYVNNKYPDIKSVWLSNNKNEIYKLRKNGICVNHKYSLLGFWYGSRASVSFINCGFEDVNKYCINNSLIVQFWHGVPLKKIKYDDMINENIQRHPFINIVRNVLLILFPFLNEKFNLIISSGYKTSVRFESAFRIDRSKIIETGYPRMDILLSEKSAYNKTKLLGNYDKSIEKIILYSPTHREEGKGNSNLLYNSDLDKINKFLQEHNSIMLIKMHYYDLTKKSLDYGLEFSNIQFINDSDFNDINRILRHIDILITDYSSVFYDYLVLDRPIIFAPFDLDKYQQIDREFYEDYNSATPGPICKNWNEIQVQLENYISNIDLYKKERNEIFNRFFKYSDTDNCKRIINTVTQHLSTAS